MQRNGTENALFASMAPPSVCRTLPTATYVCQQYKGERIIACLWQQWLRERVPVLQGHW